MDRAELATVLRGARARIRPADVGLPAGPRRQVPGLRREEVAQLAGLSVDYVVRLEQGRGPKPSPQVLGALARALRLGDDDRDLLFRLAGAAPPHPRLRRPRGTGLRSDRGRVFGRAGHAGGGGPGTAAGHRNRAVHPVIRSRRARAPAPPPRCAISPRAWRRCAPDGI
ncbi:helix-turn-helix domain-containing protein [Nocardia otitidiscaviarum]|nr:helix-turn-helix domain-containing protein [Nocardia otitidiscaviarum]